MNPAAFRVSMTPRVSVWVRMLELMRAFWARLLASNSTGRVMSWKRVRIR